MIKIASCRTPTEKKFVKIMRYSGFVTISHPINDIHHQALIPQVRKRNREMLRFICLNLFVTLEFNTDQTTNHGELNSSLRM
jgi:hypothetical protein